MNAERPERTKAERRAVSGLTDAARTNIIMTAEVCAVVVVGVLHRWSLARYLTNSLAVFYYGILGIIVYFAYIAHRRKIWYFLCDCGATLKDDLNSGRASDEEEPSRKDKSGRRPDDVALFRSGVLVVGIVANFVVLGALIVLTGGIVESPFATFGVVMVVLGQFLSRTTKRDVELAGWGIVYYGALAAVYWYLTQERGLLFVHYRVAGQEWVNEYPSSHGQVLAAVLAVTALVLLIGTAVTRKKKGDVALSRERGRRGVSERDV